MAVTIKKIAKRAGVSHGTVSDILNNNMEAETYQPEYTGQSPEDSPGIQLSAQHLSQQSGQTADKGLGFNYSLRDRLFLS